MYKLFFIVMVGWMAFKVFKDVLLIWGKKYAEKSETTLDDVMLPLFEKLGMIVVFGVAMIAVLNLMGIDVTMLLAGMGILGLVIAFAAQDTLGNFISGMFLLTDRPFKVGDLVLMENGDYCRVEHIGMRSTKLYNTFDHDVIILPNSKIANEKVINLTEPDNLMKVKVSVGVAYGTDIDKAKNIMLEVANAHPDILQDEGRAPFARMVEFGDSSLDLKLYTWVNHLDSQWRVGSELREAILHRFEEVGIEIPFPQRVVHMENASEPKETPKETIQPKRIE
jgi:small-conductance mechanosensitive channel